MYNDYGGCMFRHSQFSFISPHLAKRNIKPKHGQSNINMITRSDSQIQSRTSICLRNAN
ncbi:hypothetical protein Hanom_Chr13g01224971 [Helianthus anomalus]